ncbi:hypothetical protein L484_009594 [Morus notabilis]|uniref:Uncharacterized protein n=1 Tax=Morus notabilis TaxID=981085 RepID=W9QL86_9ROSA|nr:hypothetical protein L484_009594 [Morus notabilis]
MWTVEFPFRCFATEICKELDRSSSVALPLLFSGTPTPEYTKSAAAVAHWCFHGFRKSIDHSNIHISISGLVDDLVYIPKMEYRYR